ncbi:histidine kinase [Salinimicrobium catena]|uniref:helix-turn-helix and ligand-binding sensor domain-containing protein n=1 Tax=Salinimicrobium catena TaxID=390640 RepID=UPI002FE48C59
MEYEGASQNWAISSDDQGIIYAANNQGLLSYDGQRWELFPLKNGAVIRSVLPHQGRIYTGSYQEFGYWKRNEKGEMNYTSLMSLLKDPLESEEFWEILAFKNAIYFRSFGAIYKYENEKIEVVKNVGVNKMTVYKDRLLIAVSKKGLFYLEQDGTLEPIENQEMLNGKRVLDLEVDGNEILIGTRDQLFIYKNGKCNTYPHTELNIQLAEHEFNHILKVGDKQLLLATVRNGVLHHEMETGKTSTYNRENGLQNNTVLGMTSVNGKLWLALDDGIDELHLNSSIRFYTDHTGELGAVYDLARYHQKLYAASNTGVYQIQDHTVDLVKGAQGHSWNLEILDNQLYSNHNSGTFRIKDGQMVPIDSRTGSFQILKSAIKNKYLIGNYTGISIYEPSEDSLVNLERVRFPVKKLLFEDLHTLWAEHANEGIYRIGLNQEYSEATFVTRIGAEEEVGHRSKIFSINKQIAILKNQKWYRYNKFKDRLERFPELEEFENHELLLEDENGYWFSNKNDNSLLFTNFRNTRLKIGFEELDHRTVIDNEKIVKAADSLYYLTLKDGFAQIDLQEMISFRKNEQIAAPIVKGLIGKEERYDLSSVPTIPFENGRKLTILAGLPGANGQLHYQLKGDENLEGTINNGSIIFQNLSQGGYQLRLFALSPQGISSAVTTLDFVVEAPWYLSLPMKFVYIILLLGITGIIYLMNKRKLQKHREFLEQKLEKEHQERIERLERKRLEDEIMLKRKELANTTMMAAKKNEVLMDIQGELNKDKDKFSNQYRLKHIMTKINKAIKSKDEWQVFETNFKEVHEDFSKDLLERFPNLTGKDIKLCSYLKMNLTSKEIAPLMGKSVRGVEVHRYRLRKKLKLDSEENLSNYFIKNF